MGNYMVINVYPNLFSCLNFCFFSETIRAIRELELCSLIPKVLRIRGPECPVPVPPIIIINKLN